MRFVVAVKQVPDTMSVRVDENGSLIRAGVPSILDPYCEVALRSVLSIREKGDTVVAVTMGPDQASDALRRCIELGADEAVLLSDRDFAGADTWATSRALAAFIRRYELGADLYAFGRQAIDGDTGQVPYEVACLLGVQQFAYTETLTRDGDGFVAVQDYVSFERRSRVPRGSVVSFGTVDPNGALPSAAGYLRGRSVPIRRLTREDLGVGPETVGLKGSVTRIVGTRTVSGGRRNVKVEINDPRVAAQYILKEVRRWDAREVRARRARDATTPRGCRRGCWRSTTWTSPRRTGSWCTWRRSPMATACACRTWGPSCLGRPAGSATAACSP